MYDDEQRREDQRREAQRDEDQRIEQRRVEVHQEESHRRRLLCFSCGLFMATAGGLCTTCAVPDDRGSGDMRQADDDLESRRIEQELADREFRRSRCNVCGLFTATVAGRCTGCVEVDRESDQPDGRDDAGREEYRPDERRREAVERLTGDEREMLWCRACQNAETYEQARDRFWEMLTGQGSTGPGASADPSDDLLKAQMRAYSQNFDTTPQLNDLWERACQREDGRRRSYADARGAFWQLVNEGQDADSRWVRAMLEMAQFELGTGRAAPRLRLETGEQPDVLKSDRRLTIDHATAQSHDSRLATASENLRFMTGRDNSFRGDRYHANDQHIEQAAGRGRSGGGGG